PSVYTGLVFAAFLFAPLDLVLSVVTHALSRRNEFAADRFAARTTGTGEALASGLERLSAESLANLTPHPLYVALHYSHPPPLARIRALRAGGTSRPPRADAREPCRLEVSVVREGRIHPAALHYRERDTVTQGQDLVAIATIQGPAVLEQRTVHPRDLEGLTQELLTRAHGHVEPRS